MDLYTIGGGEIVYEVLKAVALCLNGGSGTLTAMLRIGGFTGAFAAKVLLTFLEIGFVKKWEGNARPESIPKAVR
ncbi:MAG: conjugal transfer protein TraG N-terminal domain-containing protein [Holosporaceae bacterium]|jgi:hypothetical protein|nr:conjugal transfer protein TraG N-terminal domain-containing protein [Holosporaceae bacterium]